MISLGSSLTGTAVPKPSIRVAPSFSAAPVLNGRAEVGQTLTVTPGTASGMPAPTVTTVIHRSATGTSGWTVVASGTTYTLLPGDETFHFRARSIATNLQGSVTATSASLGPVAAAPVAPSFTTAPTLGGTAEVGQTLTVTPGTASGVPAPTVATAIERSADGSAGWATVASGAIYTLLPGDEAFHFRARSTATNAQGVATATSASLGPVAPAPVAPSFATAPTLSGTAQVGQTLAAAEGVATGVPAPTVATAIERSADGSAGWATVASGAIYTLLPGDEAFHFRALSTATNAQGTATAASAKLGPVAAVPVEPPAAPSIVGWGTFVGIGGTNATVGSAAPMQVPYPTGRLANDIAVIVRDSANEAAAAPLGWAALTPAGNGAAGGGGAVRVEAFWRRIDGTESGTVDFPAVLDHQCAVMYLVRGCPTDRSPIEAEAAVSGGAGGVNPVPLPAVTTTVPNCLVVHHVSRANDSAAAQFSDPANGDLTDLVEHVDQGTALNAGGGLGIFAGVAGTAKAIAQTTVTAANPSQSFGRHTVAFRPSAARVDPRPPTPDDPTTITAITADTNLYPETMLAEA